MEITCRGLAGPIRGPESRKGQNPLFREFLLGWPQLSLGLVSTGITRRNSPRLCENVCEKTLPKAERDIIIGNPMLTNLLGPYTYKRLAPPDKFVSQYEHQHVERIQPRQ